jgi:hypothetical protein
VLPLIARDLSRSDPPKPLLRAHLEVVNVSTERAAHIAARTQSGAPSTQPEIYAYLHNDGTRGTTIASLRLLVRAVAPILPCAGRAPAPITPWKLGVTLPARPKAGDAVPIEPNGGYALQADGAATFDLKIRAPEAWGSSQALLLVSVEARQVTGNDWTDLGRALVLVPELYADDFGDGAGTSGASPSSLGALLNEQRDQCATTNIAALDGVTPKDDYATSSDVATLVHRLTRP